MPKRGTRLVRGTIRTTTYRRTEDRTAKISTIESLRSSKVISKIKAKIIV